MDPAYDSLGESGALSGVPAGVNGELTETLWSLATAREIVALLTEDIARGELPADDGAELIARVWARAAHGLAGQLPSPAHPRRLTEHGEHGELRIA